jgi:predicted RND superfamily exporter protein
MCSVVAAVGFAGWLGYELNIVSTMASLLIAILALADTVHIGTTYLKERKPAVTNEEALNISLQKNLRAIFLTSLTTIAGLYSLNFVGSVAFAEMANIAIYGVVIAFVFSISLFPAILLLLTRKATYKGLPQQQLAQGIADISVRYRKPLFIVFTVLVIVTAPFISLNRFNDDYRQFFDEDMDIRLAMEALIRHMEASNHIEYAIASGTEDGINNPGFLKKVEAFVDWYKEQPGITHVYSYVDFLKRLNQTIQDGNPAMYRIPETQELASQYLLLYEFSSDIDQLVNDDKSILRIVVTIGHLDKKRLLELEERAQQWLQRNQPDILSSGISLDILFGRAGRQVLEAMKKGSVFTVVVITVILIMGLRSLRYGLLSLIPNLVPAVVVYGLWGIFVKDMSQAVTVTYAVSLGMIVDDTVHILAKYVQERKTGEMPEQAIRNALENTATALIATTLIIGFGLIIISFATFKPNADLGIAMAPIVFLALFFDLLLLPGILLFADRKLSR